MPTGIYNRKKSNLILTKNSYSSIGMGFGALFAYFKCAFCKLDKKKGTNIAHMEDEVEYGIKTIGDIILCDHCYYDFYAELQGENDYYN